MPPCLPREPFASTSVYGSEWTDSASLARRVAVPYVLPGAVLLATAAVLLWHGPIVQWPGYNDFADQRSCLGIAHAADVLSNLGFALVGLLGLRRVCAAWHAPALRNGRAGWVLFFAALLATSAGSAWYHLAPDNARLVWDRLPIALACAGLLAAVWRETIGASGWVTPALAAAALASVAWWRHTDLSGAGDLRPYLLLQLLPLILVPLLQWQHEAPMRERLAAGAAMLLYVLAKGAEWADAAVLHALVLVSGHTLKHLLATVAAGLLAAGLFGRLRNGKTGEGR